jgi:hypothetical protein
VVDVREQHSNSGLTNLVTAGSADPLGGGIVHFGFAHCLWGGDFLGEIRFRWDRGVWLGVSRMHVCTIGRLLGTG